MFYTAWFAALCSHCVSCRREWKPMTSYRGSCHCGRVKFEVDLELDHVRSCDCSICRKRGALIHRVQNRQLRLLRLSTNSRCTNGIRAQPRTISVLPAASCRFGARATAQWKKRFKACPSSPDGVSTFAVSRGLISIRYPSSLCLEASCRDCGAVQCRERKLLCAFQLPWFFGGF